MDRTKTGALIAAARKEQNMTQKELAAALHVSDRAVSKWERGAGFPDISLLEPLADALGLRVLDGRANYLLFQAPETLGEALRQRGAVLRSCANYPGLGPGWYRTAVRTGPENEQLLKLLAEVLE